jgi:hypothetical protein
MRCGRSLGSIGRAWWCEGGWGGGFIAFLSCTIKDIIVRETVVRDRCRDARLSGVMIQRIVIFSDILKRCPQNRAHPYFLNESNAIR